MRKILFAFFLIIILIGCNRENRNSNTTITPSNIELTTTAGSAENAIDNVEEKPVPVTTQQFPFPFVSVSAGSMYSAAIAADGSLWTWGLNYLGQLGDGTGGGGWIDTFQMDRSGDRFTPAQIGTETDWVFVSAGGMHCTAIKADGSLWAWGDNRSGQLGNGSNTGSATPIQMGTDTDWAFVSAGSFYNMAIKTDGSLWAWGHSYLGNFGDGTTTSTTRTTPVRIGTENNWASVSAGYELTAAIKMDGSLFAWGEGGHGIKIGSTPVKIGSETKWASVFTGSDNHIVAIRTDGSLWAFGFNLMGQLGDGTTTDRTTPVRIGTDNNWSSASLGGHYNSGGYTIAVKTDGSLWAWGSNGYGQFGDGTTSERWIHIPTRIGTDNDWAVVSTGGSHTVAIKTNGSIWFWGVESGEYGPLDAFIVYSQSLVPVRVMP
ncbi:MAG: hypothetical protein LBI28_08840 [Treponema sp.]|jgi:alpha-tubulin suppressor-like RCC1 family protein|nr:hypothetical protein [Treponema sp.]